MSWSKSVVAVAAVAFALGVAPAPAGAQSGEELVEACEPLAEVPEVGPRTCKSVESGTWLAAQTCRRVPGTEEEICPVVDGRDVNEAAMAEFEAGWLARALDLQRELDVDVPLVDALIPHTHNSANSAAYDPTVSTLDANQVVTVTDQLRLGIRAIEIDVHWVNGEAVQCHGEPVPTPAGVVHAGCSVDRTLDENLAELRAWLDDPANAGEVVLLYLENVLDGDEAAHRRAVEAIDGRLGDIVFRPVAGDGCQDLPVRGESKGSIIGAGARVIITGNCGPGGWTDWVFQRGDAWSESGSSTGYECAADRQGTDYATTLVRRYEDSTWLSKMAGGGSHISPAVMADMVGCAVNLPGLDQVHARDDRLPSLVWSWRQDEPAAGAGMCAAQGDDARFFADDCAVARPVACRTADGGWAVTEDAVPWAVAGEACAAAGHVEAGVPVNGRDNQVLRAVAEGATAPDVWLAYGQDATGQWVTGVPGPVDPGPGAAGLGHRSQPAEPGPPAGVEPGLRGAPPVVSGEPVASRSPTVPAGLATLVVALVAAGGVLLGRRRQRQPTPRRSWASALRRL